MTQAGLQARPQAKSHLPRCPHRFHHPLALVALVGPCFVSVLRIGVSRFAFAKAGILKRKKAKAKAEAKRTTAPKAKASAKASSSLELISDSRIYSTASTSVIPNLVVAMCRHLSPCIPSLGPLSCPYLCRA